MDDGSANPPQQLRAPGRINLVAFCNISGRPYSGNRAMRDGASEAGLTGLVAAHSVPAMGRHSARSPRRHLLALIGASALVLLLLFSGTAVAYGPGPPPSSTTTITVAPTTTTTSTTVAPTTTTQAAAVAGLALTGTDAVEAVALALVLIGLGVVLRVMGRRRVN